MDSKLKYFVLISEAGKRERGRELLYTKCKFFWNEEYLLLAKMSYANNGVSVLVTESMARKRKRYIEVGLYVKYKCF